MPLDYSIFSRTPRFADWDMNVLIPIFCVLSSTYIIWSTCYKDFSHAKALIKNELPETSLVAQW